MTTPRTLVKAQLIEDHGEKYTVHAFPYFPAQVTKPVIAVYRTAITSHPQTPNLLRHPLKVDVFLGPTLEEKAEAAADDAIDDVWLSLLRLGLTVTTATRTVFGDKERGEFQGWEITADFDSENVYQATIRAERA
jgi:hypothetical protein